MSEEVVRLKLLKFPTKGLRVDAEPFDFENAPIHPRSLIDVMTQVMRDNGGVGLAATQLNFPYNVFIMGGPYSVVAVFNPEIIFESEETTSALEGCLSFPGVYVDVKRPQRIEVKYQDLEGEWQNFDAVDYDARVFLHEYDHLQGITFNKRVSPTRWRRAKDRSKKEKLINTN